MQPDLSGIIENDTHALKEWMIETISFAHLSNGYEVEESRCQAEVNEVVRGMPSSSDGWPLGAIASAIVAKACALVLVECPAVHEAVPVEATINVNAWILRTLAVCYVALQRPFTGESLELVAQSRIIDGVQGNKRGLPCRADLDSLVRKTLEFASGELGAWSVGSDRS